MKKWKENERYFIQYFLMMRLCNNSNSNYTIKILLELGVVIHIYNISTIELSQENHKFKDTPGKQTLSQKKDFVNNYTTIYY